MSAGRTAHAAKANSSSYTFEQIEAALDAASGTSLAPRRKKSSRGSARGIGAHENQISGPGSRNIDLFSIAGALRRRGGSEKEIDGALQVANLKICVPPLDASEVSALAASVVRYEPVASASIARSLTDAGNAERFGRQHAEKLRYVAGQSRWLIWDGQRWLPDELGTVIELAKATARSIYDEGAQLDDQSRVAVAKHAKKSNQANGIHAMVDLAKSLPAIVVSPSDLDRDDWLLGVANGVIDLKTGKLMPALSSRLMTKQSPVTFDRAAKCPLFCGFIDVVTGNNKALARYLARVVGYSLTGLTTEQCLFFFYGHGANGKSTFLNVVKELLGDYAKQTPSETLMAKRSSGGAAPDLTRLAGARIAIANEVEESSRLAESQIKQLTGGDTITARDLYAKYIEFTPKFKLMIAGNHKPIIQGDDFGIWRRIQLVPFETTIPASQRDARLGEKLRDELPGILNWAMAGLKDWRKVGLAAPVVVTSAVSAYKTEMDVLGQWIADACEIEPSACWAASGAYDSYRAWAERNGFKPMSSAAFGRKFVERFARLKRKDGNYYNGIHSKPPPMSVPAAGGGSVEALRAFSG